MGIVPYLQALLALSTLATSASLQIQIPTSPLLTDPSSLPPSTHATLLGAPGTSYTTPLRKDNTFAFPSLQPGSYLLDIRTRDYAFHSLRIDVADELSPPATSSTGETEGATEERDLITAYISPPSNTWSQPSHKLASSGGSPHLSINVTPIQHRDFYAKRGGFDIMSYLKSPMILMGLLSAGLVFGMPYVMENMDEETKAEFAEMQKSSPLTGSEGAASQIQNFDLASWMAGKGGDAQGQGQAQAQGTKQGGAKLR